MNPADPGEISKKRLALVCVDSSKYSANTLDCKYFPIKHL